MTDVRERLRALRKEQETYPTRRAAVVAAARAHGLTWREIADILGMTQHGLIKAQDKHHADST